MACRRGVHSQFAELAPLFIHRHQRVAPLVTVRPECHHVLVSFTGDKDWSADTTELSPTRSYEVTPAGPFCVRRAAVLTQATPKLGRHRDYEPARPTCLSVTLSRDYPGSRRTLDNRGPSAVFYRSVN